jgi:hypothetical protein
LVIALYGWAAWRYGFKLFSKNNSTHNGKLPISHTPKQAWWKVAIIYLILQMAIVWILKNYTYSTTSYINGAVSEVYYYSWKNNEWNLIESQNYKYTLNKLTTYTRFAGAHQEIIDYNNQDTTQIITHKFLHNDTLQYTNITTKKFENNKIVYTKIASITPSTPSVWLPTALICFMAQV